MAYIYDINAIIICLMQSRSAEQMQKAFQDIITCLNAQKYKSTLNVMDNECSKVVERYITSKGIKIQLVPPSNHRVNAAEQAIQTVKDRIIAGLCTIDPTCPLQLWDDFFALKARYSQHGTRLRVQSKNFSIRGIRRPF